MAASHAAAVLYHEAPPLESLVERFGRIPGLGSISLEDQHVRLDTAAGVVHAQSYGAPWPDEDPDSLAELGGPAAGLFPGALQRAGDQNAVWPAGELAARVHRGFVHVLMVESTAGPQAVTTELERISVALLSDPAALCVFFPAGESLRDGNILGHIRGTAEEQGALPLQSWVNGRLADAGMGTRVADLIGLRQIGQADAEAVFPDREDLAPYEVLGFLLDVAHHLAAEGGELEDGVIYEGPAGLRWRAGTGADAQIAPARKVVRWIPLADDGGEA